MATKKQKRAQALQRHEDRMRELRERGERALKLDQERRAAELRSAWRDNHDKNHSWQKRIKECPICQDELREARRAEREVQKEAEYVCGNPECPKLGQCGGKCVEDFSKPREQREAEDLAEAG